jgi:maleate isomerase
VFEGTEIVARIGLLVPPANVVMESELYRSLPHAITLHTSRMTRSTSAVTVASLREMVEQAPQAARALRMALPDVILFGCTSGSFIEGLGWDGEVARQIQVVTGTPALTTTTAVLRCLQALGVQRIAMATPYIAEITEREAAFFAAHGFAVCAVEGLEILESERIARTPLQTTYELARRVDRPEAEALFISCTNLRTLEAIAPLEEALGKPVISSNLASLWYTLDHLGLGEHFRFGGSRLLDWLRIRPVSARPVATL